MKKKELVEKVVATGVIDEVNAKKMTKKMLLEVLDSAEEVTKEPIILDIDEVSKKEIVDVAVEAEVLTRDSAEDMTKGMLVDVLDGTTGDEEEVQTPEVVPAAAKEESNTQDIFDESLMYDYLGGKLARVSGVVIKECFDGADNANTKALKVLCKKYSPMVIRDDVVGKYKIYTLILAPNDRLIISK